MEEAAAHELYVKLKGFSDTARFKRGLGFGSRNDAEVRLLLAMSRANDSN